MFMLSSTLADGWVGAVWAMDFHKPQRPVDNIYPYVFMVRDLASGNSLLSLPVPSFDLPDIAADAFPEKTVDIFFAGEAEGNSSVRRRGIGELKALSERGIRVDVADERLPWAEYTQRMARAWLTWSPEGVGWECYRPGEALQCRSVPLINTPTIERYAPLLEGVHAFHFDIELGGLTRAVEAALADKEKLKRMALAGREFVRAHRTHRAIVDHVIEAALSRAK